MMFKLKLPKAAPDDPASLLELERSLDLERRNRQADVERAELAAGDALLHHAFEGRQEIDIPVASSDGLVSQLRTLQHSITAVRQRRVDAVRAKHQDLARRLQAEADSKRREIESIGRQSDKLLAQLSKIEGVEYTRRILTAEPAGTSWFNFSGIPLQLCAPTERLAADHTCTYQVSLSRKLWEEITTLEKRATAEKEITARTTGSIRAQSEEDLLAALYQDPEVIAPPATVVEAWIHRCERMLKEDPHRSIRENCPRSFHLEWDADGIISTESFMEAREHRYAPEN